MAKKKLTLEDMLVPVDEIPYEVPENWCWVKLGNICEIKTGRKDANHATEEGEYPFFTCASEPLKSPTYSFDGECILLAGNGANVGLALYYNGKLEAYQRTYVLKSEHINMKYLLYNLNFRWKDYNEDKQFGSATNYIKLGNITEFEIPIPPLAEQERIVNRIESLFDKVERVVELVDEARDGFEKRRAAILERAFSGQLTKKWREENSLEINIEIKAFKDIATVKSNLVKPQEYMSHPHIAPDNIEKKTGRLLEYRTIEEDNVKSAKHKFYPNQILYSKIRPYLSKVVLVDFEGLCSADMYPIETELETRYLYWYMLSQKFLDYASNCGSRSVLPKINQKELSKIPVPVVSIEEQKEIVKIIDKLIESENSIEEISDISETMEIIKKSILAKAFRGELGSNDLNEESSIELLKQLIK